MKLPQLHLRDLFWLTLVVALGLGWWVDHRLLYFERCSETNFAHRIMRAAQECGYTFLTDEGSTKMVPFKRP